MLHTISSDVLKVTVSNKGAEIQNIISQKTNKEFLWQGNPRYWGGRAPILFPVVGGLKNGSYQYKGQNYLMAKHGFVRAAYFYLIEQTNNKLVFEYVDSPSTRVQYPFVFSLQIIFTLEGNKLNIDYRVTNQGKNEMYFGLGSHEAYNCPLYEGEAFNDYYLEFEKEGLYESHLISASGLLAGERFTVFNGKELTLEHSLFDNDALIFKNIESKKISIKSKKSPSVIEVSYDAPHMGIWQKPGAPYICIEPWCGLPDHETSDGDFTKKEGSIRLPAGSAFIFNHSIVIIE